MANIHRRQADFLEIEALAKRMLADEYDGAQERGEVAGPKDGKLGRSDGERLPTAADIGLPRKDIHDARLIRDAEAADPGIVRRTLDEKIASGEEPTKAALVNESPSWRLDRFSIGPLSEGGAHGPSFTAAAVKVAPNRAHAHHLQACQNNQFRNTQTRKRPTKPVTHEPKLGLVFWLADFRLPTFEEKPTPVPGMLALTRCPDVPTVWPAPFGPTRTLAPFLPILSRRPGASLNDFLNLIAIQPPNKFPSE